MVVSYAHLTDVPTAATILYERLQRLKTAHIGSTDPHSRIVADGYLGLINVLSCVNENEAWILSTKRAEAEGVAGGNTKRAKIENGIRSVTCLQVFG